ncbi:hypothetical protein Tco_1133057 [Tanacetum coccineum]|uniref:Uncharacterized protein n=1 Tax=Tanacetum coccineum TaxID=301880 RepID=A0ABQ5JDN2_9ASTR
MTTVGPGGHRRCRSEVDGSQEQTFFNPEILAHQKRQWYQFQSRSSDTTKYQDPTPLFKHFLIAGIHPNANLGPVEDAFAKRKKWEAKSNKTDLMDLKVMQFRSPPSVMVEPQADVMRRSPSLSELNHIVYRQEHLSRDDLSFIFSLKVADNATLYSVCLHTQEFVQRPPGMLHDASPLPRAPG